MHLSVKNRKEEVKRLHTADRQSRILWHTGAKKLILLFFFVERGGQRFVTKGGQDQNPCRFVRRESRQVDAAALGPKLMNSRIKLLNKEQPPFSHL